MNTGDSLNLNLLPSQAKFQAARMKLQKTLRYYMAIALVIWVAVVVVIVVFYFGSGIIMNLQNKKYGQVSSNYQGMSQEIILNQLLKYRAKVLGQVLKGRFEYSTAFEKINSIFSEKAKVSKFELNENKEFKVEVSAANKEAVDYVENVVTEANMGKVEGIKKIALEGADYSVNNGWTVSMIVSLQL